MSVLYNVPIISMRLFIRQAPTHATGSSQKFLMEFLLFDILERESSFNHLVSESENLTTDVMLLIDFKEITIAHTPKMDLRLEVSNSSEFRMCIFVFQSNRPSQPERCQ